VPARVLVAADSNAADWGILGLGHHDESTKLALAIGKVKAATTSPWFGVTFAPTPGRCRRPVGPMITKASRSQSFALDPKQGLSSSERRGLSGIPSVAWPSTLVKWASWGADAGIVQGGEGGGHRPIATTLLVALVLYASAFLDRRLWLLRWPRLAAALSYVGRRPCDGRRRPFPSPSPPLCIPRYPVLLSSSLLFLPPLSFPFPSPPSSSPSLPPLLSSPLSSSISFPCVFLLPFFSPLAIGNAAKFKKMSRDLASMIRSAWRCARHVHVLSQVRMAANTPMLPSRPGRVATRRRSSGLWQLPHPRRPASCSELIDRSSPSGQALPAASAVSPDEQVSGRQYSTTIIVCPDGSTDQNIGGTGHPRDNLPSNVAPILSSRVGASRCRGVQRDNRYWPGCTGPLSAGGGRADAGRALGWGYTSIHA